jgi:hypothetical protein
MWSVAPDGVPLSTDLTGWTGERKGLRLPTGSGGAKCGASRGSGAISKKKDYCSYDVFVSV